MNWLDDATRFHCEGVNVSNVICGLRKIDNLGEGDHVPGTWLGRWQRRCNCPGGCSDIVA